MSEDRMIRMEELLQRLAAEMTALRADMTAARAEMATKDELASLRADMTAVRAEMATKEDIAGCAKNVDVTLLGRQMRELLAIKDDVTVLTAIAQRLDHTMTRQMNDVLTEVRAEHSRMDRLLSRVRALEDALPPEGG